MSKSSLSPRRAAAGAFFRAEIVRADAEGVAREDMTLKLTLSDVSHLKRDPTIAVDEISFANGVMRFLGVKVEQGGVAESVLERA